MGSADRDKEEARKKEEAALAARLAELKKNHEAMQRQKSKDK